MTEEQCITVPSFDAEQVKKLKHTKKDLHSAAA